MHRNWKPLHLYIDRKVAHRKNVRHIIKQLNVPHDIVDDSKEIYRSISNSDDPVGRGKEVLFVTANKGRFLRGCPGTRHYNCCGYQIIHIGSFCVMDCSYCILQTYFHPPVLQLFVNHEDLLDELNVLFSRHTVSRVGTGEFTDSLIWENHTDLTRTLVNRFAEQDRAVLELKTKTTAIEGLQPLAHNGKTIVSWSLNTPSVIRTQERGTANLEERLQAAAQCARWGYPVAFHFDPIILYAGCEADYESVIDSMFTQVPAEKIVWISMGMFRFMPALKTQIQKRFPQSKIIYEEFITGLDGKMRYFKPLRLALYRKMVQWVRARAPEVQIYFCMEDDEIWSRAMGYLPKDRGGLSRMLDRAAMKHCGIKSERGD
jgi:DNA repair photolyase